MRQARFGTSASGLTQMIVMDLGPFACVRLVARSTSAETACRFTQIMTYHCRSIAQSEQSFDNLTKLSQTTAILFS